jgi:hypothetical protein
MIYFNKVSAIPSFPGNNSILYLVSGWNIGCDDLVTPGYPVLKEITSLQTLNQSLTEGCYQGIVLGGPRELRPGITSYEQLGVILEALEMD